MKQHLRPEIRKIWDYVESGYASICSSIEKLLVFVCLNFADHATLACFYPCLVNQEKEAMLAVWLLRPISLVHGWVFAFVDAWDADADILSYLVVSYSQLCGFI